MAAPSVVATRFTGIFPERVKPNAFPSVYTYKAEKRRSRMSALETLSIEARLADELIGSLAPESVEIRDRGEAIEFRLRKRGWKLGQVLLSKFSLRKMAGERDGRVKLEYLRRDIERSAVTRRRYSFPRNLRLS
jgi:hypothetical protein